MGRKHALLLDHAGQRTEGAHVVMALLRTAALIDRACVEELSRFDLSEGRLSVLLAAADAEAGAESATPGRLAEQLGVTRAAVTGLIDGLERQGLIRRAAHPSDRRSTTVEITGSGREALDRLAPVYGGWLRELSAEIGPDAASGALAAFAAIQRSLPGGQPA